MKAREVQEEVESEKSTKSSLPILMRATLPVSAKIGRVLNVVLLAFLCILIRSWYLAVVQHEDCQQKARIPQRRTVVEHVGRATIRDRFNIPLALNRMRYDVGICYAYLRQIPSVSWEIDVRGERVRVESRRQYISKLAKKLGSILNMDSESVEDTIHAKSSLMPHAPFTIAEDISEWQYYELKMLEREWPGIVAQRASKRFYPLGKTSCDVVGTMGAISSEEYYELVKEVAMLEEYLERREAGDNPFLPMGFGSPLEARDRLTELREKAYRMNDFVGKTGIEAEFDEELRGYSGKRVYEVDTQGNFLRELPGTRHPLPGQRVILSLSAELQDCAERLLAEAEWARISKEAGLAEPWIRGGAIVALNPNTGEVLALASHPRIDPNDFIPTADPVESRCKRTQVRKWLETENCIGDIWDGRQSLDREFCSYQEGYWREEMYLTWSRYLDATLPKDSPIRCALDAIGNIGNVLLLQETMERFLRISGQDSMESILDVLFMYESKQHDTLDQTVAERDIIERFLGMIPSNRDKLMTLDLCRLLITTSDVTSAELGVVRQMSLDAFFAMRQTYLCLEELLQKEVVAVLERSDFASWRVHCFREFLRERRKQEREDKRYASPYIDYLRGVREEMCRQFWHAKRVDFMAALLRSEDLPGDLAVYTVAFDRVRDIAIEKQVPVSALCDALRGCSSMQLRAVVRAMRPFSKLERPLWGRYGRVRRDKKGVQRQKHLAATFYPHDGFGYGRSQAFRQSTPAGSIFKLVIAYEALRQKYLSLEEELCTLDILNPLWLTDSFQSGSVQGHKEAILGWTEEGQPITRVYKGGRLPRSSHSGIGRVDMIGAIEQSSNIYFSILASEHIDNVESLTNAARMFGFGEKTGIELPGEIAGQLPEDLHEDKAGLYAYAIGQHSTVVTPLQMAVLLATIAADGNVVSPSIVQVTAGKQPERNIEAVFRKIQFPYQKELALVGIEFPLFTSMSSDSQPAIDYEGMRKRRHLFLPEILRRYLLTGMERVVRGSRGTARAVAIRQACPRQQVYRDYRDLEGQFVGKTGTAELLYKHTIDPSTKAKIHNHTWFGAVSFFPKEGTEEGDWERPELVVVVYLRFADWGREGAPLAAQIVKKWREICTRHGTSSYISVPNRDSNFGLGYAD